MACRWRGCLTTSLLSGIEQTIFLVFTLFRFHRRALFDSTNAGVKGIGPVLAKVLLTHFDSVQAIYDLKASNPEGFRRELETCVNTAKQEGRGKFTTDRVQKLLSESSIEDIRLYRQLLALRRDVELLSPACPQRLSVDGPQALANLNSSHFRYLGERRDAESELDAISPSLSAALVKLRRAYHLLDRVP